MLKRMSLEIRNAALAAGIAAQGTSGCAFPLPTPTALPSVQTYPACPGKFQTTEAGAEPAALTPAHTRSTPPPIAGPWRAARHLSPAALYRP